MSHLAIRSYRIFDGHDFIDPGVVEVVDQEITAVHRGEAALVPQDAELFDLGDALVSPGLVDVHCHGGGGASFGVEPWPAIILHRLHGSTTLVASLVTQPLEELEHQVRMLAPLVQSGELAGIHLEGPWLAAARRGAHPLERLRPPAADEITRILDAGDDTIKMVTIAPELDGGLAAVRLCAARGVLAAIGHTDADLDTTKAAIAAGARGATHLFNAMPALHHRNPGPILGLLQDDRVWLELIVDGVHVHLDLVCETFKRYGDRVVLVTDAMAAAGGPDGDYLLGERTARVVDGVARLVDGGAIAGSTLTLEAAVRNCITAGVDARQALRAATSLPADYLGLAAGEVGADRPADLVVWTPDWHVDRVLRRGRWLT